MPLPKLKYIVAPSVDFMLKQSYPNTEEEDPRKFVLPMPQSIRVNLVYRGALLKSKKDKSDKLNTTAKISPICRDSWKLT